MTIVPTAGGLEFDTWMFGKAVQAGFNTFRFFAVGAQTLLFDGDQLQAPLM